MKTYYAVAPAKPENPRKRSRAVVYKASTMDVSAVLARGLGNKVNAPVKVAFEVKV